MGYSKKLKLQKVQSEFSWMGEKNPKLYEDSFESALKQKTEEFYKKKADHW